MSLHPSVHQARREVLKHFADKVSSGVPAIKVAREFVAFRDSAHGGATQSLITTAGLWSLSERSVAKALHRQAHAAAPTKAMPSMAAAEVGGLLAADGSDC